MTRPSLSSASSIPDPQRSTDSVTPPDSSEHRLQTVYGTALDALFVVDDARRHVYANDAGAQLLGSPGQGVVTRRIDDFTPPEHLPVLERLWSDFRRDGAQRGHYQVLRGDGSKIMVEYRATWSFGPRQHLIAARQIAINPGKLGNGGPWAAYAAPRLTPREREVLQLAAGGHSAPAIAEILVVSIGTARTHLKNAYKKLEASDRASAVAKSLRLGLID